MCRLDEPGLKGYFRSNLGGTLICCSDFDSSFIDFPNREITPSPTKFACAPGVESTGEPRRGRGGSSEWRIVRVDVLVFVNLLLCHGSRLGRRGRLPALGTDPPALMGARVVCSTVRPGRSSHAPSAEKR